MSVVLSDPLYEEKGGEGVESHFSTEIRYPVRVVVDPNAVSRDDPTLTPVMVEAMDRIPNVGEYVIACQPEEDDTAEYISTGRVRSVNREVGLAYIEVDWAGFVDTYASGGRADNPSRQAGVVDQ